MTKHNQFFRILILLFISVAMGSFTTMAQENGFKVVGKIFESGTGLPVKQAVVSVVSNGAYTNSSDSGVFEINLPSAYEKIMISYPGYHAMEVYTNGQAEMVLYLTDKNFKSDDEYFQTPLGDKKLRDATNAVSLLTRSTFAETGSSSFDQDLNGAVSGLHIIEHSGMPGHNSWINLRGISSIFARNEPLVFIDGMIHEIKYPNNHLIEGHLLNPMDIVDVDDLVNISVLKSGEAYLGSAGSNGVLDINTEQNEVTSASILVKMYGGIAFPFQQLDVMTPEQYKPYFTSLLNDQGFSNTTINQMHPWLNGNNTVDEYYRYNNNTNWQDQMTTPSAMQKYYIFLKGGDDIATYNISSGYLRHSAPYDGWRYSRYNLRLNGKINITNKLYVVPNTKLSLTDSYLSNMGPTAQWNPVTSSLLKPPIMAPHEKSEIDGSDLYPFDDVGVFNASNPAVLINEALGSNRNFQLLSSGKIGYDINANLSISHLIGTSVNNDRSNLFIPDVGVVQISIARNSPRDMVTEFRSVQNHTNINYKNTFLGKHNLNSNAGVRFMNNMYKNNLGIDLNTPSDNFRSLGQGSEFEYLRSHSGEAYELKWVSYYGDANYSYLDKYYLRASLSVDGASVFNSENRFNLYYGLYGAWRLSSEPFMQNSSWINDFKVRASFTRTGNMYSSIYDLSKLTYTGRRYNSVGVVVRDYNPNVDMSAEKKNAINAGVDVSFNKKAFNLHIDYHLDFVNNLLINQSLPYNFGFTDYIDNGGALRVNGLELAADGRMYFGQASLILGATVTMQSTKVSSLEFLNPETNFILNEVAGATYIASVDNPVNAFYGYKTNGIYQSDAEANGMIGPNGKEMGAGDVRFVDVDGNKIINDADKQIIGDPNPGLFGSLSGVFTFKRFEFTTLFTYCLGNDMYNYVNYKTHAMDSYANQSIDVLDRWTSSNASNTMPKASMGDPKGNNAFSDRWIEDGSYLRLKQFTVSYTTPNIFSLQKETKFYVTGSNLLTLTKYSGYDPETMYQSDPFYMGIDYGKLPLARSVIFGIQISL